MTREERDRLRAATGMRRLLEIEAKAVEVRDAGKNGNVDETGTLVRAAGVCLDYRMRRRAGELPSVRPVLALAADAARAEEMACVALAEWRTVMTATLRADDGREATLARRAEDALALARLLAHRNAGKTVIVRADGGCVPPAALMLALERGYFSGLEATNSPQDRKGWPSWREMAQ